MALIRARAKAVGQIAFMDGAKRRRRWVVVGEEFDVEEAAFSRWMVKVDPPVAPVAPAAPAAAEKTKDAHAKPKKPAKDAPAPAAAEKTGKDAEGLKSPI